MRAPEPVPEGPDNPAVDELHAAVAQLGPASVALLNERLLQRRFDRKYLASYAHVADLFATLRTTHHVLLAGDQGLARYDSIYFDTSELRAFHDHRRGRPRRAKVRIRTYADRDLSMLEVKQRSGRGTTVKARRERDLACGPLTPDEVQWAHEQTGWAPPIEEAGSNSFRRVTLLGVDHVERVTIDVGLSFSAGPRTLRLDNTCLVEVKTPTRGQRSPSAAALYTLGLRPRGFSKYCVGSLLLDDSLPANRFKPALRQLSKIEGS